MVLLGRAKLLLDRREQRAKAHPTAAGVVLSEVARMFRATTPQPDIELCGVVVRLDRAEQQAEGTATLLALVEE